MFVNMFLLYFLANGIRVDWQDMHVAFNGAWALVLANLVVHWVVKLLRYNNLDEDDRKTCAGT